MQCYDVTRCSTARCNSKQNSAAVNMQLNTNKQFQCTGNNYVMFMLLVMFTALIWLAHVSCCFILRVIICAYAPEDEIPQRGVARHRTTTSSISGATRWKLAPSSSSYRLRSKIRCIQVCYSIILDAYKISTQSYFHSLDAFPFLLKEMYLVVNAGWTSPCFSAQLEGNAFLRSMFSDDSVKICSCAWVVVYVRVPMQLYMYRQGIGKLCM